jgi:CRISPR-associated protein Cmr2
MKYEFHAQYPLMLQDSVTQAKAIDWLAGKSDRLPLAWRELPTVQDEGARIAILAQAIATAYKEQARMGTRREAGGFRYWLEQRAISFLQAQHRFLDQLELFPIFPDLTPFPPGSFTIHFTFTLRKPYISRDDTDFHILDNPVKKEWVFKVPYVAPSQWKGALRAAMMQEVVADLLANSKEEAFVQARLRLYRLFGNEKDGAADFLNRAWARYRVGPQPENQAQMEKWKQEYRQALGEVAEEFEQTLKDKKYRIGNIEGFQGCLHFYPTYFDRIGLEVINPHPRDVGAGQIPIYFECVPQRATGTFTLLYVPLGGPEMIPDEARQQAAEDLTAVAEGIQAMMTRYGFGAKTSDGFGVVEEEFVKDEQGKSQAIIRVKDGKGFRCRSFAGLRQAAAKLAEELSHVNPLLPR